MSHACKENIKIRGQEAITGGRRAGERVRADGEAVGGLRPEMWLQLELKGMRRN